MIGDNLARIRERMAAAAGRVGRSPEEVALVAVSKRMPVAAIQEAYQAGQRLFGENYLQEAEDKVATLPADCQWHFIGHLQSNKARKAAELFTMIETVDRPKLARALERHLAGLERRLAVLVQVNVGREPQKSGVSPEDLPGLLATLGELPHLQVRGLMTMPPFRADPEETRPFFRRLRQLAEAMTGQGLLGREGSVELSMGMSHDFEVAIEEGATLVRVGTALFGPRPETFRR